MRWLALTMSLKVSAILPERPVRSPGMRTEKSPIRTACRTCNRVCRSVDDTSAPSARIDGGRGGFVAWDAAALSTFIAHILIWAQKKNRSQADGPVQYPIYRCIFR